MATVRRIGGLKPTLFENIAMNKKRKKREPLTAESRAEKLEGFEAWLWDMPNALKRFKNRMPPHIQSQLDFSIASLDTVEQYLLSQYQTIDDIMAEPSFILDGYAVYVGETFRKALKGNPLNQWELMLVEDNVFFDLPVIHTTYYIGCPLTLVTASLDRRTGHYWSGILNNILAEQQ